MAKTRFEEKTVKLFRNCWKLDAYSMQRFGRLKQKEALFKWLGACVVLLVTACLPMTARATCTSNNGMALPLIALVSNPIPVNFDPTVPVGTVIGSETLLSQISGAAQINCTANVGTMIYNGVGPQNTTYSTFPTTVAGVSYRIKWGGNSTITGWWPQPQTFTSTYINLIADHTIIVEFVKTGPITSGGQLSGIIGTWNLSTNGNAVPVVIQLDGSIPINPTIPTCTATAPPVSLGVATIGTTLRNVGDMSPAQSFNVTLVCSGGAAGITTNLYATLTDQTNPGNTSNQLSLTPSSIASGVKIQVLNGATILGYGPDSNVIGNTNQWLIQNGVGNTTLTLPLSARYIQTAASPAPGSANGTATMTLSYQ